MGDGDVPIRGAQGDGFGDVGWEMGGKTIDLQQGEGRMGMKQGLGTSRGGDNPTQRPLMTLFGGPQGASMSLPTPPCWR